MWILQSQFLFDAIRMVETGGHPDPANAIGDGGLSLGPYQITEAYWKDAIQHRPEIGGRYEDVKKASYAERIMMAYWDRYSPDDNAETLARIHNGGPRGHRRSSTDAYWLRVRQAMDSSNLRRDRERVGSEPRGSQENSRTRSKETATGVAVGSNR